MEAVSNSKLADAGRREHLDEAGFAASSGLLATGAFSLTSQIKRRIWVVQAMSDIDQRPSVRRQLFFPPLAAFKISPLR